MKIKILGTGGAFSDKSTSYLINNTILIDCSEGTIKDLIRSKEINNIKYLVISHKHSDHVGGLELFIFYKRFISKDINEVTLCAGSDVYSLYKNLACSINTTTGEYIEDFRYSPLFDISGGSLEPIGDILINYIKNTHCNGYIQSYSFTLVNLKNQEKVFISGDIDSYHPLLSKSMAESYKYIFYDMGWTGLPRVKNKVHPTEQEIYDYYGYMPNIIGIHTSSLLHYYQKAKENQMLTI